MRGNVYSILSVLSLVVGCVFLFNSLSGITGYVVAENVNTSSSTILGIAFFAGALGLSHLASREKKGQAAMEFLMTYGWAILAAIVAIGALAYFGVFSPGNLVGSSALVNNPFYAASWQVIGASASAGTPGFLTGNVTLELTNSGGDNLYIYNVTVTGTGSSSAIGCTRAYANPYQLMTPGNAQVFSTGNCVGTLTVGNNFAGNIKIGYFKAGSTLNQSTTGTIRATIGP